MVYVSLDVEKLLKFVSSLQSWGDKAMQESDEVKKLNNHWDPPAVKSIASEANSSDPTSGDASGLASVRSVGDYLSRIVAIDLKRRCEAARQMNSDGILPKTLEGRLTYFLPDDAEDTAANVEKNNTEAARNAKQDAAELQETSKTGQRSSQGRHRTNQEIIDNMETNQDNPIYGSEFLKNVGSGKEFLDLYNIQKLKNMNNPKARHMFSHILASASQIEGKGRDLAENISNGAMYKEPIERDRLSEVGRLGGLNELLHYETAAFGTNFLEHMGDKFVSFDPYSSVPPSTETGYSVEDLDVHNGVLSAMGRNPVAATNYLAGKDAKGNVDPQLLKTRWNALENKYSINKEDATFAMKAASSLRTDPDYGEQATNVAARSIAYAANKISKSDYTDAIKKNVSVVLANCSDEIHNIANGAEETSSLLIPVPEGETDQVKVNRNTISTAIYNVIDNKDAAATISASVGRYAVHGKSNGGTLDGLANKYQAAGADLGYLNYIANERFNDNNQKNQAAENTTKAVGGAFRTLIGAILPKGVDVAWDIGTSVYDAVDAKNLEDKSGNKIDVDKVPPISDEEYLKDLAITESVNSGMMTAAPNYSETQVIEHQNGEKSTVTVDITDGEGKVIQPKVHDATYSASLNKFKNKFETPNKELTNAIDKVGDGKKNAEGRFAKGGDVHSGGIVISKEQ